MTIEVNRTGLYGKLKHWLAHTFPAFYLILKRTRWVAEDRLLYNQTRQIRVADVSFLFRTGSFQEFFVACGWAFEEKLLQKMLSVLPSGGTAIDVGAATGVHTLACAKRVGPEGRVFSIEPDRSCRRALRQNLRLNAAKNVTVIPCALWDKNTQLIIHTNGVRGEAPQVTSSNGAPTNKFKNHFGVYGRRLDTIVSALGIRLAADVIKIDVEGGALKVLGGFGELRPKHVFIEIHPMFGEDYNEVLQTLNNMGYFLISQESRADQIHAHFRHGG